MPPAATTVDAARVAILLRSRPTRTRVSYAGAHEGGGDKLRGLPGLKEARWVELSSLDLLHPGPRLAEGLEELFRLLHPEPASVPDGGR